MVIAIVILAGSKPTTEPLRRMTLYWAKRGSAPVPTGNPASALTIVPMGTPGEAADEAADVSCMRCFSRILVLVTISNARGAKRILLRNPATGAASLPKRANGRAPA